MIGKITLLGFAIVLVPACPTQTFAQSGRPVSARDISGKTICWSDGARSTYAANGQYTNDQGLHSVWSVPQPGVVRFGSRERQTEVLADGRLHSYYLPASIGGTNSGKLREYWGTVCK
jgi:hypothetical protein